VDSLDITRDQLVETGIAVGIIVAVIIAARLVSAFAQWLVHFATNATDTDLDDLIAQSLRRPLVLLIIVQGVFITLRTLSYLDEHAETIDRLWVAATLVPVVWFVQNAALGLLDLSARRLGERDSGARMERAMPLLRRAVNVLIILLGGLIVLGELGISISPLLAGLGLGGLAVALALQPILSNIFAGSYVMSDGSIRVGDFIQLEGGPQGWVQDIGWRATRILTFDNNRVIIPNAVLAETIVTNYDAVSSLVDARVACGVAYEADLEHVERVSRAVLDEIVSDMDIVVKEREPVFMYTAFGDSNIDILMKVQAVDRAQVAVVEHEIIRRIHRRYAEEDITINYPARRLFLEEDDVAGLDRLRRDAPPPAGNRANGADSADSANAAGAANGQTGGEPGEQPEG